MLFIFKESLNKILKVASEVQLEKACAVVNIQAKEHELIETKKLLEEAQEDIDILETELAVTKDKLQALQELAVVEKTYALNELRNRADLLQKADQQIVEYEVKLSVFISTT